MSEKEKGTVERKVRFNQDEETGKKSRNDKGFTRGRGGRGKGQPQRPRPTLDVFSPNLIHLWNVSNTLDWMKLKKTLSEKFGNIKFIETFEAWTWKKIGHVVLEFETSSALNAFVDAITSGNLLENDVQWEVSKNRRAFFHRILTDTGVDLLNCRGIPETFQWRNAQKSNMEPPVREPPQFMSNGGMGRRNDDWMNDNRRYNQPSLNYGFNDRSRAYPPASDAELRSRALQEISPYYTDVINSLVPFSVAERPSLRSRLSRVPYL